MKKSILIIGSGGFFGNSILDYLNKKKILKKKINKIILVSRSKKNQIPLGLKKNYKVIQIKKDISKAKRIIFADYVIYCAISKNYADDYKSVKNYFRLAKKYHKNSSIVYTSSGAVYGKQLKSNFRINDLQKIESKKFFSSSKKKYSLLKIKNEKIFKDLSDENIKVCVARCFAFVGKHLPLNTNYVVGNFIKSILENKSIEVESKIKVSRTYMHAQDLAECLIKLAFENSTNFTTYNIGSDNIIDIHSLAKKLSKKYKIKNINQKSISKKDYDRYVPSISKFRKKFKFKKQLNSYNAIIKTIKEFKLNK
jgi:nucleoside-diphosphate-sugar epimerase